MAMENDVNGGNTEFSLASTSRAQILDREAETNHEDPKKKETETTKVVPFYKLFSFADSTDVILMIMGTISAIGNGVCLPMLIILFGELTDAFGQNQSNDETVEKVSKVNVTVLILDHLHVLLIYTSQESVVF